MPINMEIIESLLTNEPSRLFTFLAHYDNWNYWRDEWIELWASNFEEVID